MSVQNPEHLLFTQRGNILILRKLSDIPVTKNSVTCCMCRCCSCGKNLEHGVGHGRNTIPGNRSRSVFDLFYEQLYSEKKDVSPLCAQCGQSLHSVDVDTKSYFMGQVVTNVSSSMHNSTYSGGQNGKCKSCLTLPSKEGLSLPKLLRAGGVSSNDFVRWPKHEKCDDDLGLPLGCFQIYLARETHQLAEANQEKNARLKEAFGLTDYVDGSAFDPDRKAKEEAAKAAAAAQKKYSLVQSSEEDEGKEEASIPHKKKKKRSRHDSTSPDRSKEKRRKSRKHSKRDRSHSKKSKKSKHRSKRRSSGKRKHRRHHSTSSSDSDSHDDSGESDTVDLKDKDEMSAVKTNGLTLSPLQSLVVQRKESTPPILPPPQTCQIINKSSPPKTMVSPKVDTGSNMKYPNEGGTLSRAKSRSASRSRSRSNSYHSHSYRRSTRRSSSKSSSSRSRSRTHSPTFSLRRHSHSKSHSRSRSRSRSPSSGSDHRGGHRDSRSPSIRRRHGSPSHLDKRRITSARKRPVPYYRPSPSPSQSDSDNSFSLRRSRSKSHTSRSRFRSLSRSPSLDLHYRRRKQPQRNQNPTEYHPPQQHYFHQPLHQHVAHSTPASSVPPFASQYPATCLISQ